MLRETVWVTARGKRIEAQLDEEEEKTRLLLVLTQRSSPKPLSRLPDLATSLLSLPRALSAPKAIRPLLHPLQKFSRRLSPDLLR